MCVCVCVCVCVFDLLQASMTEPETVLGFQQKESHFLWPHLHPTPSELSSPTPCGMLNVTFMVNDDMDIIMTKITVMLITMVMIILVMMTHR